MWYRTRNQRTYVRKLNVSLKVFFKTPLQQRKLLTALKLHDSKFRRHFDLSYIQNLHLLDLELPCGFISLPQSLVALKIPGHVLNGICVPRFLQRLEITQSMWCNLLSEIVLNNHTCLKTLLFHKYVCVQKLLLPPNLVHLQLPYVDVPIAAFPESLQILEFGNYEHAVDTLPPRLREWDMGQNWSHRLPNLPNTLEKLRVSRWLSRDLGVLPPSLTSLQFYNFLDYEEFTQSDHPSVHLASFIVK